MIIKNIISYSFIGLTFLSHLMASEIQDLTNDISKDDVLIVGCTPWDKNLEDVQGLEGAHFLDFCVPQEFGDSNLWPSTFHHYDLNDEQMYSSGRFSEFAQTNPKRFQQIVIDWCTYNHIGERGVTTAWQGFQALLKPGGQLIIPAYYASLKASQERVVLEKVNTLIETHLRNSFDTFTIGFYEDVPGGVPSSLLRRSSAQFFNSENSAVVVASKKVVVETVSKTLSREEVVSEEELIKVMTFSLEKYRTFKFPSSSSIKSQFLDGYTWILNEDSECFRVQSVFGTFFGFKAGIVIEDSSAEMTYCFPPKGAPYVAVALKNQGSSYPIHLIIRPYRKIDEYVLSREDEQKSEIYPGGMRVIKGEINAFKINIPK
jgi:hypothetical protein